VVYSIEPAKIKGYQEIDSNLGKVYIDSEKGNVIMSGQNALLLNYDSLDTSSNANIIKIVSNSIGYPITEDNIDGDLHFFKTKDGVTVVTDKDIGSSPYAIMGAFSTITDLEKAKERLDSQQENKQAIATTPKTETSTTQATRQAPTELEIQDGVKKAINFINQSYSSNVVKYKAAKGDKGTITVFTDYTCPHCQGLHKKLKGFLDKGYNVDYILMPRAGANSAVAKNMTLALCSVNPRETVDYLFEHKGLPAYIKERPDCKANAGTNLSFATAFKVQGTPTLIGSTGKISAGFNSVSSTLNKLGMGA
jgi:protein-disulfide isomerase